MNGIARHLLVVVILLTATSARMTFGEQQTEPDKLAAEVALKFDREMATGDAESVLKMVDVPFVIAGIRSKVFKERGELEKLVRNALSRRKEKRLSGWKVVEVRTFAKASADWGKERKAEFAEVLGPDDRVVTLGSESGAMTDIYVRVKDKSALVAGTGGVYATKPPTKSPATK